MPKRDAATLAQHVISLGLVNEAQFRETVASLGVRNPEPELLCRAFERKGYLTPWQSQKLLKGELHGYFLGGYRLLYRIASGSFGRVFRADDPASKTVVAIKVLRRRWSEKRRAIELFEREGKLGMSLNHPNIVKILDVGLDNPTRQYYIVMEFVEGGNLRDLIAIRGKFEPLEALRVLEDAALGLVYAYSLGLTHRDIKPTNILISSGGKAKLVDFGLADIFADSALEVEDDTKVYRTVDYMGLERATGVQPGDTRSDVFFLGCVFYEMLTGKPALALTPDIKARKNRERFLNLPTLRADEILAPLGFFQLFEKMCALNPLQRFQTPSQLLDGIRAARRELDGGAAPYVPPPPDRSVFLVEKNRHLQETLRAHLKKEGYRVLLAVEASLARERYAQAPYDALILDAGTVGLDGVQVFDDVLHQARRKGRPCVGFLILSQENASWAKLVPTDSNIVTMVRPITLGQLIRKMRELVPVTKPVAGGNDGATENPGL
jgi:serine/threonine protein kinase